MSPFFRRGHSILSMSYISGNGIDAYEPRFDYGISYGISSKLLLGVDYGFDFISYSSDISGLPCDFDSRKLLSLKFNPVSYSILWLTPIGFRDLNIYIGGALRYNNVKIVEETASDNIMWENSSYGSKVIFQLEKIFTPGVTISFDIGSCSGSIPSLLNSQKEKLTIGENIVRINTDNSYMRISVNTIF